MSDEPERKDVTIGVPAADAGGDPIGEEPEDEDGGDNE